MLVVSKAMSTRRGAVVDDDVLFKFRLRLFSLAAELGNVREACRLMDVHPSTYYRWRGPVLRSGLEMLRHRKHDVLVFHVLDDDEVTFPFAGATRFEGMEELPSLVCDPRALRRVPGGAGGVPDRGAAGVLPAGDRLHPGPHRRLPGRGAGQVPELPPGRAQGHLQQTVWAEERYRRAAGLSLSAESRRDLVRVRCVRRLREVVQDPPRQFQDNA